MYFYTVVFCKYDTLKTSKDLCAQLLVSFHSEYKLNLFVSPLANHINVSHSRGWKRISENLDTNQVRQSVYHMNRM